MILIGKWKKIRIGMMIKKWFTLHLSWSVIQFCRFPFHRHWMPVVLRRSRAWPLFWQVIQKMRRSQIPTLKIRQTFCFRFEITLFPKRELMKNSFDCGEAKSGRFWIFPRKYWENENFLAESWRFELSHSYYKLLFWFQLDISAPVKYIK